MKDHEYWWDRSGPSDPDIAKLERLLSPLRYRPPGRRLESVGYLQAGLALAAVWVLFWIAGPDRSGPPDTGWSVNVLAGSPRIGAQALTGTGTLVSGQWLTTDDSSAAEIVVSDRGRVRLEPGSRIYLVSTDTLGRRVRLTEGMVHVAMWGPSRGFVVETPAASAADLDGEYTLTVDERGHGVLCVESGWVSLERDGRTALVPSGAQCEMRPGRGPGTPYLAGASTDYLELLRAFDFDHDPKVPVNELIEKASPCDAFSLVYLVERVEPLQRGRIFDRVAALYPPWSGITRAGIVALETSMVATWQDQFECFESEVCRASCLPDVL